MISRPHSNQRDSISRWETPQLLDIPAPETENEQTIEELRAEAKALGHAEGYQQGLRQGEAEINRKLQNLTNLMNALSSPYADLNEQVLESLTTLAGKIARALVKRELHTNPDTIMALVRDTVAILNTPTARVHIHLHPEDARLMRDLMKNATDKNRWMLLDDPMVARGDCKVSNQDSIVDGNLASRINTVITQFQGDERG